ncbi:hypothetical protein L208DRAFT_1407592 [Tricholoma matsutake]|nr:hypothetical protein L208DRAFT_1407592 [Tricholoma matsutake 945]
MHSFSLILSLILPALYANIVLAIPLDSRETGSSYSGAGGQSPGGSVYDQGIVNVLSNNAGDGGLASSGKSSSGSGQTGDGNNNMYSIPQSDSLLGAFRLLGNAGPNHRVDAESLGRGHQAADCGC